MVKEKIKEIARNIKDESDSHLFHSSPSRCEHSACQPAQGYGA
ncbi:hypothetical protein APS_1736 [Acetobacter pasteurianus subsp. pasteurianus LMG 1262 = NBRC 106471]|uniref:Uncharacterized protein n=1 Tax=Acetobacter pasteurianus TaxID=438 RepID=A0A1A0DF45_ACEPA|nr:hypothetical protein SRCM100623_00742 [Acetobacter pasteurianus]GAB31134.1 hypothetical protein APS_1736 [Acetobacter pasteurianus subsp. pasteurianus LMG 1262 = NBRC 106471]GCD48777.1 hypothetical protein NBRC106471_0333 [Acetobacter pasteurianus subsp. pasteurianus LMG 1262 = NBRC 106471]